MMFGQCFVSISFTVFLSVSFFCYSPPNDVSSLWSYMQLSVDVIYYLAYSNLDLSVCYIGPFDFYFPVIPMFRCILELFSITGKCFGIYNCLPYKKQ